MKIGSFDNQKPAKPAAPAPAAARDGTPAAGSAVPEASAKVQLSPAAAALSGADAGDFDSAKVQRIAQAIRDGKFEVNPEAIADKLIASTSDLLGPKSQH
jgi:negative regulator of flagellin synthesis FlgM